MEPKDLIDAGLTRSQAKVYLKLMNEPEQTGGEIAKAVSMDRSFVYAILASLTNKGLISHVVSERTKLFYPTDPGSFLKESKEKNDRLNRIVMELKKIQTKTKTERTVRVYNGKAGLKLYMRELLDNETFSSLDGGSRYNISDALKSDFPHYLNEFRKKKMRGRIITSPENAGRLKKAFSRADVRIKTRAGLKRDTCFTLFDGKLAIYSLEDEPYVVMIRDKSIANTLMDYFNVLWGAG